MASFWNLIFRNNRAAADPSNSEEVQQSNSTLCARAMSKTPPDQPEPLDVTLCRLRRHLHPELPDSLSTEESESFSCNSHASSQSPSDSMPDQSVSVGRVLEPGATFKGYIFIPGYEEREEYTLQVLPKSSSDPDDLGPMVSHAAYGDEQVCVFRVVDLPDGEQDTFKVTFSDAETFCEGTFSLHSLELKGSVSQVKDEPGFWLPKEEETHRFELKLQDERDVSRAKRASDHVIAQEVLEKAVGALRHMEEKEESGEAVDALFRSVDWDALWAHAILQSEECACRIRATTDWLNDLRFDDQPKKREVLASLQGPRTRAGCHRYVDDALVRVQMVLGFRIRSQSAKAVRENGSLSLEVTQELMQKAQIQRQRLFNCYASFDRALRSAELRPPQDFFEKHKCQASEDFVCSICQVEGDGISEVLSLDCGHRFHVDCAAAWIHQRAQCPNCRCELFEQRDVKGSETADRPPNN